MRMPLFLSMLVLCGAGLFAQDAFPGDEMPPDKRGPNQPTEFTARPKRWKGVSAEDNMRIANDLFARRKYNKASQRYQQVAFERNSPYVAEAQFQLAECYFRLKRYAEARVEYEVITRQFVDYPQADKAYFQIGVCWFEDSLPAQYTQEETRMAINAFNEYLERYAGANPDDEAQANAYLNKCNYKLLEKKYYNGYIYYRMVDYSAALLYFDEVRLAGLNDRIDKLSLYYSGKIYLKRKDFANATSVISLLAERYPGSKEARRLKKRLPGK